uniref:Uncharacterized protein n=1 Tax=Glossina palpalis gambiensis TaxID=67801 RepID=A0A1B0BRK2_9MUSC
MEKWKIARSQKAYAVSQYLAMEISRGNSRDNKAVARFLPSSWLYNAPSSLQQGSHTHKPYLTAVVLLKHNWLYFKTIKDYYKVLNSLGNLIGWDEGFTPIDMQLSFGYCRCKIYTLLVALYQTELNLDNFYMELQKFRIENDTNNKRHSYRRMSVCMRCVGRK